MANEDPDRELLYQVCQYAARRAQNSVLIEKMYSSSLGAPVFLLVAFGEQALAIEQIVMATAVPDESALIERPAVKNFAGNGKLQ